MASVESPLSNNLSNRGIADPPDLSTAESKAADTLYFQLGGDEAIEATVMRFYELIMEDPVLLPFFEGVDVNILQAHQQRFLTLAFTKMPDDFDAISYIFKRHHRLFKKGLNETHFDRVAGHLVVALKQMWVAQRLIDEVIEMLGPFRAAFEEAKRGEMVLGAQRRVEKRQKRIAAEAAVAAVSYKKAHNSSSSRQAQSPTHKNMKICGSLLRLKMKLLRRHKS